MEINIKNCNNIDEGNISIVENKLNIKFGINGTGKSTIAKAIKYSTDEIKDLSTLTPFKLRENNKEGYKPMVSGVDTVKTIFIFDEEYVKRFIFKQDELIENSFDILINTPIYQKKTKEIDILTSGITNIFNNDPKLSTIIEEFKKLSDNFKITNKDDIAKTSKGHKILENGNKIKNIPEGLEPYQRFLQSELVINWLEWHNNGEKFLNMSTCCPYCTSAIVDKEDLIRKVGNEYDKNTIKNSELLISTIEKLGDYFAVDTIAALKNITTKKEGPGTADTALIVSVKKQIDILIGKFEKLKYMSHAHFRDIEKVEEEIRSYIIADNSYEHLKSTKTGEVIRSINASLEGVLKEIGILQKGIGEQKSEVKKLISKHKIGINQFLKNAGYKYEVVVEDIGYKLRLKHIDSIALLNGGAQHLSFGEKNAFALVLFMYESLSKNPDLIVLDDPISSFDDNKKYAIMEMLFMQKADECLKNRTVLMLTHDIEPVIDTTKVLKQFKDLSNACFLELSNGALTEQNIEKSDILTFSQICNEVISNEGVNEIIKLIYLRRDYEVTDDKGNEYEVLSNLIHKRNRQKAEDHRLGNGALLSKENFDDGVAKIKNKISSFDYDRVFDNVVDVQEIKKLYKSATNNYEKLQLFRIHNADDVTDVMQKYINELYHIENELINQLNPLKFNLVPEYLIKECDIVMNSSN